MKSVSFCHGQRHFAGGGEGESCHQQEQATHTPILPQWFEWTRWAPPARAYDPLVRLRSKQLSRRGQFTRPWHFLYFLPLPQEHRSLRPGLGAAITVSASSSSSSSGKNTGLLPCSISR